MLTYRKDIDGLRAIAILAVICFHYGWFPGGYLGVDVFIVISGYLITGIIYKETEASSFSLPRFYQRRIARIIPLLLFISLTVLVIGSVVMLPDDLENLCESVIATNLFSNNILQLITTRNYWDVVNDFKPLLHTWSLGLEEQYYLFFPFLFLLVGSKRIKWVVPLLIIISIISLVLFLSGHFSHEARYYLLPFRFFEFSAGGIGAIFFCNRLVKNNLTPLLIIGLIALMQLPLKILPFSIGIPFAALLIFGIIISSGSASGLTKMILENKVAVFIGRISYSLFMWHQVILAFTRYFIVQHFSHAYTALMLLTTFLLSLFTYYFIEQPFRLKMKTNPIRVLLILTAAFLFITGAAAYVYLQAGVLRDVPELDISIADASLNMHGQYNARVFKFDKPFTDTGKIKVLVIGNSFARDWANVLLESRFNSQISLSYAENATTQKGLELRMIQSDYIFYSDNAKQSLFHQLARYSGLDTSKIYCVGLKNFGTSNGVFYNHKHDPAYCMQRAVVEKVYLDRNNLLKRQWGSRYINLLELVIDSNKTVPVFTTDCKFISQDCRHFTKAGAQYFAGLINSDLVLHNLALRTK